MAGIGVVGVGVGVGAGGRAVSGFRIGSGIIIRTNLPSANDMTGRSVGYARFLIQN